MTLYIWLAILSGVGLIALLVEWTIKSKKNQKKEKEQRDRQRQAVMLFGPGQVAQVEKEKEQAQRQAIGEEYQQLQVDLAAVDVEIQMMEKCRNIISQQGWQIPAQLELSLQKQQLEKKLLEWSMNGVMQKNLYDSVERQIEQIEAQLPIVERGEMGMQVINQQGEVRNLLQQIAQEQAVALGEFQRELEQQGFTPAEVHNIMMKADDTLKELAAMTAAALTNNPQQPSLSKSP
jgi:hypothetical protein